MEAADPHGPCRTAAACPEIRTGASSSSSRYCSSRRSEQRERDRRAGIGSIQPSLAFGCDRPQLRLVAGPGGATLVATDTIEEADMRLAEIVGAGRVAQSLAKFAQIGRVLDADRHRPGRHGRRVPDPGPAHKQRQGAARGDVVRGGLHRSVSDRQSCRPSDAARTASCRVRRPAGRSYRAKSRARRRPAAARSKPPSRSPEMIASTVA